MSLTRLVRSGTSDVEIHFSPGAYTLQPVTSGRAGETAISVPDGTPLLQAGAPELQKLTTAVIIPDQGSTAVTVTSSDYYEVKDVSIAPSKGNLKRNINPADVPYTYGEVYAQDKFFPATIASLGTPYILRDVRGQAVSVCPFQYNPVKKVLRVFTSITVAINAIGALEGENQFERTKTNNTVDPEFNAIYQKQFINYGTKPIRL